MLHSHLVSVIYGVVTVEVITVLSQHFGEDYVTLVPEHTNIHSLSTPASGPPQMATDCLVSPDLSGLTNGPLVSPDEWSIGQD